jgi:hypothetical protein
MLPDVNLFTAKIIKLRIKRIKNPEYVEILEGGGKLETVSYLFYI